jgi:hypothetical protein
MADLKSYLTSQIGANINFCDAYNNIFLHLAPAFGSVDIFQSNLDKVISIELSNT